MPEPDGLPRWQVTSLFPSLDSTEFAAALGDARRRIQELVPLFDARGIRRLNRGTHQRLEEHRLHTQGSAPSLSQPSPAARPAAGTAPCSTAGEGPGVRTDSEPNTAADTSSDPAAAAYDEITRALNALHEELRLVRAYLSAFTSTDARNDTAQALSSDLRASQVTLDQLETRYVAWVGSLDVEALLAASDIAREHEYVVRRAAILARHQMAEGEEELAAALLPAGLSGWARLHRDLTALQTVRVNVRGEERVLPMSSVRSLATDPDRFVREAAYRAELAAWQASEVPLAAALNGVKGYQQVVRQRRGYPDDVVPTLLRNQIDPETMAAMQTACVESLPDFRRYMRVKARALGLERLAWYDVSAPLGGDGRRYSWPEAEVFIRGQFGRYSGRMHSLAERAFREGWIDAEPREGKAGGAFCMPVRGGESRILMNYDGSSLSISTLAHELGHAYHNLNLERRPQLLRQTPSTLAETASTFCEQIAFDAALGNSQGAERLTLLEVSLQRDLMVVVDIHSRFLFEQAVFERRARRELMPAEFCELMLEAQRQTYAEGLDPDLLHPYMWAVKGHYYGPTFYNYPYTFGLLFGLGLYAAYQSDPAAFPARYDALLSTTGMANAADLARPFSIDTRDPAFWRRSLGVIRTKIDEFARIVGTER
jgi:pepF/M3 family oligoendopeptidase